MEGSRSFQILEEFLDTWKEEELKKQLIESKRYMKADFKRWVKAYRQEVFNVLVNTNIGVERQKKALKYVYLDMKKTKSLSQLLSTILTKFLPDSYIKYVKYLYNPQYQFLLTEAQRSAQCQSADMTERIGAGVLQDVCVNEEDTQALLMS
ncbi:Hypothetical predicted protein [Mytilus galloprovincialis]|uniref:Uncharacterized protein n=1 Tax=Mytilus galloprovincialis TaxID=29158 RepID=A0A8B6ER49_MYTGA|nr:Hypothetical predicted protein [Mytilus galloprovincialis]